MGRHDLLALDVRDGITGGDLDGARRAARALAAVEISPRTPRFDDKIAGMHAASMRVATAGDATIALELSTLARTCSDCHARFGGPTTAFVGAAPPAGPGIPKRMTRHAWAVDQLWIGIVFNSEAPWLAGASVLSDPALSSRELVQSQTAVVEIDALATSVHRIGVRSKAEFELGARTRLFGELLTTCVQCHERTGHRGRDVSSK